MASSVGSADAEVDSHGSLVAGAEAAAYIAYGTSDSVVVQPFFEGSRSSIVGSEALDWNANGRVNTHGEVPSVLQTTAASSTGEAILSLKESSNCTAVLTGSVFLRKMLPNLYQAVASNIPSVLHVAALKAKANGGEVSNDFSDVCFIRETGAPVLFSGGVQDIHDMAIVAHSIAERAQLPVVNCFDGSRIASEVAKVKLENYDSLQTLISGEVNKSGFNQVQLVESVLHRVGEYLNRPLKFFEYHGPKDATCVLIASGVVAQSVLEAVRARVADKTRTEKSKVGVVCVRVYRPWSARHLVDALPESTRTVCVIDQTSEDDASLFKDVAASFHSDVQLETPLLISGNIVLPNHLGITPAVAQAILHLAENANENSSFKVDDLGVQNVLSNSVIQTSSLLKQSVVWSTGGAADMRFALSMILGPQLNLNVQQCDSVSHLTGVSRSDLRFGPMEITSEYPILGANVICCLDASVLLIPQVDVLAQAKPSGTVLLVNAAWTSAADLEQEFTKELKNKLASLDVELVALNADALVGSDNASWLLLAGLLHESGSTDFMQTSSKLQQLLAVNKPNATELSKLLPQVATHFTKIELPASWRDIKLDDVDSLTLRQQSFVPGDMSPVGVVAPPRAVSMSRSVTAYHQLLSQLFGERLIVADTNATEGPASVESYYGRYMVKLQGRERLVKYVHKLLQSPSLSARCSKELIAALSIWHTTHDHSLKCGKIIPRLTELLKSEKHKHEGVAYVFNNQLLLAKSSKWIVGGEHWSYDLSTSGIHHVLASKQNVNILVLDTEAHQAFYPETSSKRVDMNLSAMSLASSVAGDPQQPQDSSKKDIGLYAMNYGTAYVASISALANHSQAMRAFSEADAFEGPSIIIAHAPAAAADMLVAGEAVKNGKWPLYRWNPADEDHEFQLDSSKLKQEVQSFLDREQQLSILASASPDMPVSMVQGSLESQLAEQHKQLSETQRRAQFDSLVDGLGGNNKNLNLLVLYGSDSGNGAGVAEKLAKSAESSGCGEVRCLEANDFNVEELSEEKHVVVIMSTAGQGETCSNAKHFYDNLMGYSSKLPGLKYSVFGLGDSHYWGEGTADSATYFCLTAREIDAKLAELGAERVVAAGLGDDQNDDGYEGALNEWEPQLWDALDVTIIAGDRSGEAPEIVDDDIKIKSDYLRGMIDEGLADLSTGKLLPEDTKLTKFHGIYQQDLRSVREELDAKGLERAYSFMIRIGVPGGVATSEQYIQMDDLCSTYANGALKVTTRQAYQFHGVLKKNLKTTMKGINRSCLDTLAACGDVNRNVIANPHLRNSALHKKVNELANDLNVHLKPRTSAYAEIWLDKKKVAGSVDEEPIYGKTYLPRKFKIAIAVPPLNDVDVFSHCLGFIAIADKQGRLQGYNVCVGGGMGTTHGNKATYPRLSDVMGFCTPEQAVIVAEKTVLVQRDFGERENRKHSRLKYTVEDMGVAVFRSKVEELAGFKLSEGRPFKFDSNADPYGWNKGTDGLWDYTMYVENGYIKDSETYKIKTALREIAELHTNGEISLTATQNVIIGAIPESRKAAIQQIMTKYNIDNGRYSAMRLHSMACVALPTCALAMAAAQTYLPELVGKLEDTLLRIGLRDDAITIRMTGCPNGCARPYMAEIAFVGKAPGQYNLYLGGGFAGNRINKMYKEGVDEKQILAILTPMLEDYATQRLDGERFGDFVIRKGIIEPTLNGHSFWAVGKENDLKTPSGTNQIYW